MCYGGMWGVVANGGSVEICDAKYAPPPEIAQKPLEVYPPPSWQQFMEEVRLVGPRVSYLY